MSVSGQINQTYLNTIVLSLVEYILLKEDYNILEDNPRLSFDFGDNISTPNEMIITDDFNVTLSPEFTTLNYYLVLNYYRLDADMVVDDVELHSTMIKLDSGENTISFDEYPIYLQEDYSLIIKK